MGSPDAARALTVSAAWPGLLVRMHSTCRPWRSSRPLAISISSVVQLRLPAVGLMINTCRIRYYPALCFTNFLHYTGKSPGTQGNIFSAAELVEIAFEHTIVELALLVRLPAKKALKLR